MNKELFEEPYYADEEELYISDSDTLLPETETTEEPEETEEFDSKFEKEYPDHINKTSAVSPSIEDLQRRCDFLLAELKAFATHIQKLGREHTVELRGPSTAIQAELKSLKRLSKITDTDAVKARTKHILRSSNIPYHEAVWATAKRSSGVVAFNKRFFWHAPQRAHTQDDLKYKYKRSALVDIIAQDGLEWIKVSTVTETRLLFELARQGWDSDPETSNSSLNKQAHTTADEDNDSDDEDAVSILKMSQDLSKAVKTVRIRYKTPKIRLVLPKIRPGQLSQIDTILAQIERTGIQIDTDIDLDVATPDIESALPHMLVDPFAGFSATLNIDCTILLALVSDLSHAHIETKPWFPRATTRQIEMEEKDTLLPSALYPAMGSRELVCTQEAAERMREIVDTIGTPTERARTAVLMGDEQGLSQGERVDKFKALSEYGVPGEWRLPIRVVDKDGVNEKDAESNGLPPGAQAVAEKLTASNQSVFLYGWRSGRTTITSNRTVARQIEETVEACRSLGGGFEEAAGPDVWVCAMARSLVGKQKRGEKSSGKE